ncbi:U3 snoRNP protein [Coemansia sp. RSA 1286]|nr:U3 snoRNP protein [Coemansia sp. RSA 1286]
MAAKKTATENRSKRKSAIKKKKAQLVEQVSESDNEISNSDESMASASGSEEEEEEEEEGEEDDDEDEGEHDEDEESRSAGDINKTHVEKKKGLGSKPTNAEIMALNETALLFKSNLFKLQVDELLSETLVMSNTKETRGLDAALKQIRDVLLQLSPVAEMSVDAASKMVRKLGRVCNGPSSIPFPDPAPPAGMTIQLGFRAPSVVNVVGSYALGMAARTRTGFNVDVIAQMPSELFQERDHLNMRYFYKRAFYVSMLYTGLKQSALSESFEMSIDCMRNDLRLPVVTLRPRSDIRQLAKLDCCVRIVPTVASDKFSLRRLGADRNSIRPSFLIEGASDEDELPATPQYNAALSADALMVTHMSYLFEITSVCADFARAAALLRIWHGQRNTHGRKIGGQKLAGGRINGFVLTMVLAWLVRGGGNKGNGSRLSTGLGAHQLFKGAMEFLGAHDFEEQPLWMGDSDAGFAASGGPVLVDPTASVNILAGVQEWELAELRLAARATALDLNASGGSGDQFSRVFLSPDSGDILLRYDHVLRISVPLGPFFAPRHGFNAPIARRLAELDHGHPVAAVQARLAALIGSALESQTRAVAVHAAADDSIADVVHTNRTHVFFVGLVANAEASLRVVTMGPDPDSEPQAAARFRALWGERAELRRFRDSAIRLASVWGAANASPETRATVLPRMAAYLLRRHFSVHSSPEVLTDEDLEVVDQNPPKAALEFAGTGGSLLCLSTRVVDFTQTIDSSPNSSFETALNGLEALGSELRGLEDQLPLRVLSLHANAPGLRYTSLAPPKPLAPSDEDAYIEPLPVSVEFTSSTRWPDDLMALHKVKSAFLLRLAECYGAAHPEAATTMVDSLLGYSATDGILPAPDACYLDIRHATSGLAFRLAVYVDREGALLEKRAADLDRVPALAEQAAAARAAHQRWLRYHVWGPRHHRLMLGLCQRHHPAASQTVRLLKRWLSRHMLLGPHAVSEETAELVAAHAFTVNGSEGAPASALAGFVRTLRMLADWRWKLDLCVVDFAVSTEKDDAVEDRAAAGVWTVSGGMSDEARTAVQKEFDDALAHEKIRGCLRVATEHDPKAEWWGAVSPVITRRLSTLARASLACMDACFGGSSDKHLPQVFTTPLDDYSIIVKLDRDAICRKYEQPPTSVFETIPSKDDDMAVDEDQSPELPKSEIFKNLLPSIQKQTTANVQFQSKRHSNPFGQAGIIGFDPVSMYMRDLVSVYGDSLLLFNDVYGGSIIAGLWNPAVAGRPVPFAASTHANMRPAPEAEPVKKRPMALYNKAAVVEEIIRLGEGLVEDVVVQGQ